MTEREEHLWQFILKNRSLSDETMAELLGVELRTITDLTSRIASPNWREEVAPNPRLTSVGESEYHKKSIQPWDIWLEYNLNPWDADIIKRVLRRKPGQRRLDYEKIKHVCDERIRQLDENDNKGNPDASVAKETGADNQVPLSGAYTEHDSDC